MREAEIRVAGLIIPHVAMLLRDTSWKARDTPVLAAESEKIQKFESKERSVDWSARR